MKVISTGSQFDIYPDDLQSYDKLPADYYMVRFSNKSGFSLERYYEFEISEDKVYGIHIEKVRKVLKSFEVFNRNLGVILSGDKGIGKSLFARLLAKEAVNKGLPVIIVDRYDEGVGSFIDRIDQEILVLFDEFDKTFVPRDDEPDPQAGMLSLFDGVSQGKKLFVVTCNELRGLNGFMVNRPGRFHYHFRFDYPSAEDIRDYLGDKLNEGAKDEIDEVINFSQRVALNYDCLRAIAFELNLGQKFSEAISDLNIVNTEMETFKATVCFTDGTVLYNKKFTMDSFSDEDIAIRLNNKQDSYEGTIVFTADDIKYNPLSGDLFVDSKDITLKYGYYYYDDDDDDEARKKFLKKKVKSVSIMRVMDKSLHYAV